MFDKLITKDFFKNKKLIWLPYKDISKSRLEYINSLYGYKQLPNTYCIIKYSTMTFEGPDTEKYAYLIPEDDGILLVSIKYYNDSFTVSTPFFAFTGKSKFIPKNNILSLSIESQKIVSHKKDYKLMLKYKFKNKTKSIYIESILLSDPTKDLPIKQLQQKYSGNHSQDNNIYINRITQKNRQGIQQAKNNTIKDWTNHHYSLLKRLQICFEPRFYKVESKSEYLFSIITILICEFILSTLLALEGFYNTILAGSIASTVVFIIGMYYMVLNTIKRLHDIRWPSTYALYLFFPIANIIYIIMWCIKPSKCLSKQSVENVINKAISKDV